MGFPNPSEVSIMDATPLSNCICCMELTSSSGAWSRPHDCSSSRKLFLKMGTRNPTKPCTMGFPKLLPDWRLYTMGRLWIIWVKLPMFFSSNWWVESFCVNWIWLFSVVILVALMRWISACSVLSISQVSEWEIWADNAENSLWKRSEIIKSRPQFFESPRCSTTIFICVLKMVVVWVIR